MQQNTPTENIKIIDDTIITVPASLHLMTPYILIEQQDWFEDEINFIRKIIKPGMKVIDIGANYGLYTLSVAGKVGENGKIWAFEPTSSVAACLSQSIAENKFTNVELIQAGMSDHTGKAKLYLKPNSELNSLLQNDNIKDDNFEMIDLFTLDECLEKYNWEKIDFIKLDAEGVETNIINGGRKTLSLLSPLIMYELKHGEKLNLPLIQQFVEQGYNNYYLIPGLDILAPFDSDKPFDTFLLNLFCCKEDKAIELEKEGILLRSLPATPQSFEEAYSDSKIWKEHISKLTFSYSLINEWDNYPGKSIAGWDIYQCALNCYILSKLENTTPSDRFCLLNKAFDDLNSLVEINGTYSRLMTLARVAFEIGQRQRAVVILNRLINQFSSVVYDSIEEPFIPVLQRYENINPESSLKQWMISSILEQYEKLHAFSSYFTGQNSLPVLQKLKTLGFQSEEMNRRLQLIQKRFSSMAKNKEQ